MVKWKIETIQQNRVTRRAQPLLLLSRSNPPTEGGGHENQVNAVGTMAVNPSSGAGAAWAPGGRT